MDLLAKALISGMTGKCRVLATENVILGGFRNGTVVVLEHNGDHLVVEHDVLVFESVGVIEIGTISASELFYGPRKTGPVFDGRPARGLCEQRRSPRLIPAELPHSFC